MPYKDPKKRRSFQKKYQAEYYIKNIELWRQRLRLRRVRNRLLVNEILRRSRCIDCGNTDYRVLDFDHVRGKKIMNLAKLKRQAVSLQKIEAEMAKCEIRCANCHRIVTHERRLANT